MDFMNEINKMVVSNEKRIEKANKQLSTCPKGTLQNGFAHGKTFLMQFINDDGKRHRIRLTKNPQICSGLVKKMLLERELCQLYANRNAFSALKTRYRDFDLNREIINLQIQFPSLTNDLIYNALLDGDKSAWEKEPFEQSSFMPDVKTHITSRGLRVRSKSELLIAEKLYQYNIPFRYEQILHIGNAAYAPDFTIRRDDGKIFIWEHEGLTNQKEYVEKQIRKHQSYAAQGIVPWDNFIITYDNAAGDIDLRIVESEILNKLVI